MTIGNLAKFGGINTAKNRKDRKAFNETAGFRPTKLTIFDPKLDPSQAQDSVLGILSGGQADRKTDSPLKLKNDLSQRSLNKKVKKQVLAKDASAQKNYKNNMTELLSKTTMKQMGT